MISVRQVSKTFGSLDALRQVSFDVEPGKVTGFLGPNGAGKTTLMKIMLALQQPDTGSVLFDGVAYANLQHPLETVGAAVDGSWLNPKRTARDHLRVIGLTQGINADRVDEKRQLVGLAGLRTSARASFPLVCAND